MSDISATLQIADIIRTPTSLGAYLAPMLWGPGSTYQLDPWLAYGQRKILDGIFDHDHESFVMYNCPPQIGKSSFSGEFLPFWTLGMLPETRVIFVTYSDDFSAVRGAWVRDMVKTWGMELFGIQVDPENSAKSDWKLLGHRGGMLAVGIEGALNGRPGDLVIIDDVIKDAGQAGSVADKRRHWDIYEGTIHSRLQPGGTMLITATRWVEDDISGRIQAKMREPGYNGDPWQVISIPAIAEPDEDETDPGPDWHDELGRVEGEPLQCRFSKPGEAREDNHWYKKQRALDPFTFSCIFQQTPTVRRGGMFPRDNWRWYRVGEEPELDYVIRVWDLAATEGGGDFTVGLKMGKATSGHAYIPEGDYVHLDVQRFRKNAADVQAVVVADIAKADGYGVPIKIERERSGSGSAILDFYTNVLPFCRVTPAKADGRKENRAVPYSAMQNLRRVWLPTYSPLDDTVDDRDRERNAPDWVRILVAEHRVFMGDGRTGRHDDTVDCGAYAVLEMLDIGPTLVYEPARIEDWSRVEELTFAASTPRW